MPPYAHRLAGRSPQPVQEPPLTNFSRPVLLFTAFPEALASAELRLQALAECYRVPGSTKWLRRWGIRWGTEVRGPLADLTLNPQQPNLPDGVCIRTLSTLSHRATT